MSNRLIVTVSQVNKRAALMLKKDSALSDVYVSGEISNLRCHHSSGHVYFTLKDSDAALNCVMFSLEAERLAFQPEDGQSVIAGGFIQIYEPFGSYQLRTLTLELPEVGDAEENIYASFLKLKEQLAKDGVFANSRPLPVYPGRICLITAKDSAALQDMLVVFERRYPLLEIVLIPASVQGKGAPAALIKALKAANNTDSDLIILARGGGSAEDLWAFNDESLAREIHKSTAPVVSAIGHETDETLADYAADVRAATPTAAAELVTPDVSEIEFALDTLLEEMRRKTSSILERQQSRLSFLEREINLRMKNYILYRKQELDSVMNVIDALNPEKIFARGYSAVFSSDGKIVKSSENIKIGDELNIKLAGGGLKVTVKEKMQGM
jgi:exodeoxyribonuclease VII large subunit